MTPPAVAAVDRRAAADSQRERLFAVCWLLVSAGLGWQLVRQDDLEAPSAPVVALTLAGLLDCDATLLRWLGRPPS